MKMNLDLEQHAFHQRSTVAWCLHFDHYTFLCHSTATSESQSDCIHQMYPAHHNDEVMNLLRLANSLVRQQFKLILSLDQSLFNLYLSVSLLCRTLPCSQCVNHIVKQWLFCELLVILWSWEIPRLSKSLQNKGLLNMYVFFQFGLLLSVEPLKHIP